MVGAIVESRKRLQPTTLRPFIPMSFFLLNCKQDEVSRNLTVEIADQFLHCNRLPL
jgi:hypothetical protein